MKTFYATIIAFFAALVITACSYSNSATFNPASPQVMMSNNMFINGGCSGVLLHTGMILSAAHCATADDKEIPAALIMFYPNELPKHITFVLEVVKRDPNVDLMLLRVKDGRVTDFFEVSRGARLGQLPVLGDTVFHTGNPMHNFYTLTKGIVSNIYYRDLGMGENYPSGKQHLIQTDVGIAPGSSGGALYNDKGQLIGIVMAVMTVRMGMGTVPISFMAYAVPVDVIETFLLG